MPRPLDPATREALAERLRFYRDLGLTDFYRRPVEDAGAAEPVLSLSKDEIPIPPSGRGTLSQLNGRGDWI